MLIQLIVIVAIMVAASVFLTKGTVRLLGRFGGETIHKLHKSAEYIIQSHKVPPFWQEVLEKKSSRLLKKGGDRALQNAKEAARKRCLGQLKKLIIYFQKSSTIVDEEARGIVLSELNAAYEEWLDMDWDRMVS